jgi:hypothetical protein
MHNSLKLTEKQTGFKWNDEVFRIKSSISEDHLYLASTESIYHNGKIIIKNSGFRSKKNITGEFRDKKNDLHKIEFRCFPVRGWWLNFTVLVDDIVVYKGSTPIKGIITSLAVYLPILFLILLLLGRVLGLFLIIFNL